MAYIISTPERLAARNLDRLTDDGLLVLATDGAPPALRSYRLAPDCGEPKQLPGS